VKNQYLIDLENYLNSEFNLINFSIVPDTKKLFETDSHFKKLVKLEKEARRVKNQYINEKNL